MQRKYFTRIFVLRPFFRSGIAKCALSVIHIFDCLTDRTTNVYGKTFKCVEYEQKESNEYMENENGE